MSIAAARLGSETITLLRALFSPHALNLRNLAWHGFQSPHELDRRHVALLLQLLLRIAVSSTTTAALQHHYWQPSDADESLQAARPLLVDFPSPPSDGGCVLCLTSPFCRPGFSTPLRRALAAYRQRDHATFVCLAFPVIEAGLR